MSALEALMANSVDKNITFESIKNLHSLSAFNSKRRASQVKRFIIQQMRKDADRLLKIITKELNITVAEARTRRRKAAPVLARYILFHYLYMYLKYPSTLIMELFALRVHTSVLKGIRDINDRRDVDKKFKDFHSDIYKKML